MTQAANSPGTPSLAEHHRSIEAIRAEVGRVIVGQHDLVDRLLVVLLTNNHALIEGVPGLAKTLTVSTLARAIECSFARIQFTPDLLPADITGTLVFNPREGEFHVRRGPIFVNIVLADEINRAPAKVQSALLESMQERTVSIGGDSLPLPDPFWFSPPRTRSSRRGRTRCPRRSSTASCSRSWWTIRSATRNARSSRGRSTATTCS